MNLITLLLLSVPVVLIFTVVLLRRQIMANRPVRVGVGLAMLPLILFCAFGFLASFEGSDASFVAFRVAYGVTALTLCVVSAFLAFGRLRPVMALGASGSH